MPENLMASLQAMHFGHFNILCHVSHKITHLFTYKVGMLLRASSCAAAVSPHAHDRSKHKAAPHPVERGWLGGSGHQLRCIMQGITYSRSLSTGWKPPLKVRRQSVEQAQELRDRFHIIVEGQHLLPPILDFNDMKFPQPVLRQLAAKGISRPTPIQMQVHPGHSRHPNLYLNLLRLRNMCPTEQGPRHAHAAHTHPCLCCKPCGHCRCICGDVAGASLLIASNRTLKWASAGCCGLKRLR